MASVSHGNISAKSMAEAAPQRADNRTACVPRSAYGPASSQDGAGRVRTLVPLKILPAAAPDTFRSDYG